MDGTILKPVGRAALRRGRLLFALSIAIFALAGIGSAAAATLSSPTAVYARSVTASVAKSHATGFPLDVTGVEDASAARDGGVPVTDGEADDHLVEGADQHPRRRIVQQRPDRLGALHRRRHGIDQTCPAALTLERRHQLGGEDGDAVTVLGRRRANRLTVPCARGRRSPADPVRTAHRAAGPPG